ncbi:MAG: acyl-CoA thioesterase [Prochlorothrix sp.]|nr:thioesterase family protein [Prochlorothrix sp.]
MPYTHHRTLRFADTDAAGVIYFATLLSICHEAYEASLIASGIPLPEFFRSQTVAIPITQAHIDFHQPLTCGQQLAIQVHPIGQNKPSEFQIQYQLYRVDRSELLDPHTRPAAQASTRHVCINPTLRHRQDLPPALRQWLTQWGEPTPQLPSD